MAHYVVFYPDLF